MVRSSKTDQEYNGEYVTRECTCTKDPSDSCPAHILWDQVAERQAALKSSLGTNNVGGAPLFVGEDGSRLTQCQVLEAIRAAALCAGEALEFKGHARFGTHSMRVAGALAAFSAGIDENTIRALGRWKSNDAMMRYLRGLPVVKAAVASRAMAQALQIAEGTGTSNFQRIAELKKSTPALTKLWTLEEVNSTLLIRHGITRALHRPARTEGPPSSWKAWCGWKWAQAGVAGLFQIKDERDLCRRCFAK